MRRLARIAGLIWTIGTLVGWAVLLALGRLHGRHGEILLLFVVAGPGIFAYRWGRSAVSGPHTRPARRVAKPKPPPREWEN